MSESNDPRAVLQERLDAIFSGLMGAGKEAREHHDFGNANIAYQAALGVATTARTLEATISKAKRAMDRQRNYGQPWPDEEDE